MSSASMLVRNSFCRRRITCVRATPARSSAPLPRLRLAWPNAVGTQNRVGETTSFFSTTSIRARIGSDGQHEGPFVRLPYDSRFPPTPLDFWDAPKGSWPDYDPKKDPDAMKEGGGDYGINEAGYFLDDGSFVYVKEMVPEYVVPNLDDCEFSPYVPYNVKTVNQPAMTAEDLFETLYRSDVEREASNMIENAEIPRSLGELSTKLFKEKE